MSSRCNAKSSTFLFAYLMKTYDMINIKINLSKNMIFFFPIFNACIILYYYTKFLQLKKYFIYNISHSKQNWSKTFVLLQPCNEKVLSIQRREFLTLIFLCHPIQNQVRSISFYIHYISLHNILSFQHLARKHLLSLPIYLQLVLSCHIHQFQLLLP